MTRTTIEHIMKTIPDLDGKLDALTTLSIATTCPDVHRICNEIRNEITPETPLPPSVLKVIAKRKKAFTIEDLI